MSSPYILTQLASETFTEANVNPLAAARWRIVGGDSADAGLQVVSNTCRASSTSVACGEVYTAVAVPNDHYVGIKITRNIGEVVSLYTRLSDGDDSAYEFDIIDNGDGTAIIGITWLDDSGDDSEIIFENDTQPWANNDVFIAASIGSTHLLFQNGNIIAQVVDTRIPAGVPFIEISTDTINNVRLTNFVTGAITMSGDTYDPTKPYLGTVTLIGSAPAGLPNPFIGKVLVLGSAPAAPAGPYLGHYVAGSAPVSGPDNLLGQVVVVGSAPAGAPDPFLGTVDSE